MPSQSPAPDDPRPEPADPPPVANLDLKARLLVLGVLLLIVAAAAYVLYARGAFERHQTLVLVADHAEGVVVGMDLSFAGFAIGRVNRIELADDGNARIVIHVPVRDARWLRESSVFTLESSLVGATKIRAFSGMLSDPPLPDGAMRRVLIGDATAEIPKLTAGVRDLLANLNALTAEGAPLSQSLLNVQTTTERLNGPRGALGVLMGSERDAQKIIATLDRSTALLARLEGLAAKTDAQVFGEQGLLRDGQLTLRQLNALLADARASLVRVDGVLREVQGIAGNTRAATADLDVLRAEVEASLRKVENLLGEVNRRWPFARDTEIRLP